MSKRGIGLEDKEKSLKEKYESVKKRQLEIEKQEKNKSAEDNRKKLIEAKLLLTKGIDQNTETKSTGFKRPTINKNRPTESKRQKSEGADFEEGECNDLSSSSTTASTIIAKKPLASPSLSPSNSTGNMQPQQHQQHVLGNFRSQSNNNNNNNNQDYQRNHHYDQLFSIYVGDLSPSTNEETIMQIFKQYGNIKSIKLFPQRGFAFINFTEQDSIQKAIQSMNCGIIEGQTVKVSHSKSNHQHHNNSNNNNGSNLYQHLQHQPHYNNNLQYNKFPSDNSPPPNPLHSHPHLHSQSYTNYQSNNTEESSQQISSSPSYGEINNEFNSINNKNNEITNSDGTEANSHSLEFSHTASNLSSEESIVNNGSNKNESLRRSITSYENLS